jgi:hypothetical protein
MQIDCCCLFVCRLFLRSRSKTNSCFTHKQLDADGFRYGNAARSRKSDRQKMRQKSEMRLCEK